MTFTPESKERLRAGARKAAQINKQKGRAHQATYEMAPKLCGACDTPLSYEKRRNQYCGASCAATVNNRRFPKRSKGDRFCRHCKGSLIGRSGKFFCERTCHQEFVQARWIGGWLLGQNGWNGDHPSNRIRHYLHEQQKGACAICFITEWRSQPVSLILDHIDGNPSDHRPTNVRLVCGNCDMQLPTYKGKNKGKGRRYRRGVAL